jgi:hypothetical protein
MNMWPLKADVVMGLVFGKVSRLFISRSRCISLLDYHPFAQLGKLGDVHGYMTSSRY